MKKHLLVTYAWSINNIGDMGIQAGLMTLLREKCPGLPVKLMSYLPENDECYRHYRDVLPEYNPDGQVIPMPFFDLIGADPVPEAASAALENAVVRGKAWKALRSRWPDFKLEQFRTGTLPSFEAEKLADDLLNRFPLEIFEDLKDLFPESAEAFADAGFVYYNSGTTLNFGRLGVRRLFGYTLPLAMSLLVARALKIPYGIGSQSFDLLEWPMDLVYRTLFRDAEFVYCRDTDSLNYLKEKMFSFKQTGFRPDTTIFFGKDDAAWADSWLADRGLENGKFMTVVLRISSPKAKYHDPTGGAVSPQRCEHHMQALKYMIEEFVHRTGNKVLIAHETRDTLGENNARDFLFDILNGETRKNCVYLDFFWTPEQALAVYRRTMLLVSMEMHSIIMGIGNGVPVLHIPYAECGRKRQMVRDMGLDRWLIDIDEPDSGEQMLRAALYADSHQEEIRAKLREVRGHLEALAYRTCDTLGEYFSVS